jgi:hypothetical protein
MNEARRDDDAMAFGIWRLGIALLRFMHAVAPSSEEPFRFSSQQHTGISL